ncbi:MAG: hypothetical protein HLUCCO15_14325, partial [Erythrobacteraceae bacterium HL-111]
MTDFPNAPPAVRPASRLLAGLSHRGIGAGLGAAARRGPAPTDPDRAPIRWTRTTRAMLAALACAALAACGGGGGDGGGVISTLPPP